MTMFYSRDEIVAVLKDYYTFLCRIIHGFDALKLPPEGGWPSIAPESMAGLRRSSEVIDLLKHLPYLRLPEDKGGDSSHILPETECTDFTSEYISNAVQASHLVGTVEPPLEDPLDADCVCIAYGRRHAYSLFLDLASGTVILHSNDGTSDEGKAGLRNRLEGPRVPKTDNDFRDGPTYDIKYFFGEFCKDQLNNMIWVGFTDGEIRRIENDEPDEKDLLIRQMLTDAGFPGDRNGGGFDLEKWWKDERHGEVEEHREQSATNVVSFLREHNLDGVDFDWEYPGADDIGSSPGSPEDGPNYVEFLKLMRTKLDDLTLAIAAPGSCGITTALVEFINEDGEGIDLIRCYRLDNLPNAEDRRDEAEEVDCRETRWQARTIGHYWIEAKDQDEFNEALLEYGIDPEWVTTHKVRNIVRCNNPTSALCSDVGIVYESTFTAKTDPDVLNPKLVIEQARDSLPSINVEMDAAAVQLVVCGLVCGHWDLTASPRSVLPPAPGGIITSATDPWPSAARHAYAALGPVLFELGSLVWLPTLIRLICGK